MGAQLPTVTPFAALVASNALVDIEVKSSMRRSLRSIWLPTKTITKASHSQSEIDLMKFIEFVRVPDVLVLAS
jgi:hypothetical protein